MLGPGSGYRAWLARRGEIDPLDSRLAETMEQSPDLHREFRSLIMILGLVTAINNGGHSTLAQDFREGYIALLDTSLPAPSVVANSISTILVKNVEVIACMIQTLKPASLGYATNPFQGDTGTDPLWDPIALDELDFSSHDISGFTVVANADHKQARQTQDYVLQAKGCSHFNLISKDHWDCLEIS